MILRLIITAGLVLLISHFMTGVTVDGITNSLIVAVVLGLLNVFVKPLLKLFSFPITVLTLGLFLLVINAVIIMLCDYLVDGFHVNSFFTAFLFSIILSISQSLVFKLTEDKK